MYINIAGRRDPGEPRRAPDPDDVPGAVGVLAGQGNTVETAYKVYVCPRGNLLYCRPYFIKDPTVTSHMRVAYCL